MIRTQNVPHSFSFKNYWSKLRGKKSIFKKLPTKYITFTRMENSASNEYEKEKDDSMYNDISHHGNHFIFLYSLTNSLVGFLYAPNVY